MNSAATKTACPVCGPGATESMGTCHEHTVVRCTQCRLMFVEAERSVEDTKEFFRSSHVEDPQETARYYVSYRKDSLEREADIVRQLKPEGGRLLDVGTASGYFLKSFSDDPAWQPEGVEPSAVSATFAQDEFGLTVQQGYLHEQHYAADSFDVVTSLDAFNCHRTPNEDLAEISRILKPGGYFAVEIPGQNFRMLTGSGLLCRLLFGTSLRLNAGVNFYYYTTQAMVTLAFRAGLEFVSSTPESMPSHGGFPARVAKHAYSSATAFLYRATHGRVHYAPKEFLVFRKPTTQTATESTPSLLRRTA